MQELYFFFDDSGTLHRNEPAKKFVYAGYVFSDRESLDSAKRQYRKLVFNIKKALSREDELKASSLKPKHKRALYNVLKNEESLSVVVDISRVYERILNTTQSICRYKDYILKMVIKVKLVELIDDKTIDPKQDIKLHIFIDEQLRSTDGIYSLKESIIEELQHGIINYNYGAFHKPIFSSSVNVNLKYCESKNNYMIQACDILANRIYTSYRDDKPELRNIPNHTRLTLP